MARKKKKAGTVLSLLGVLILMILLYFIVIDKKEEEEVTGDTITLSSIDTETVTEISYTRNDITLTYMKSDDTWVEQSDTKAPINQDKITNMLSQIVTLSADKIVVEDPEDLAEYGLADPALVVNITCDDGTKFVLEVGDSLGIGTGYYAKLPDKNTVYAVAEEVYSAFNYTQTQMLAIEEFPSITSTNITNINVVREGKVIFKADYDESAADAGEYYAWEISKPYKTVQKGDPSVFDTYFVNYEYVPLSECVDYNSTDLSKYGLDNPSFAIDISYYTTEEDTSTTADNSDTTSVTSDTSSTTSEDTRQDEMTTLRTDYELTLLVGDKNEDGEYYVQIKADGREYENAVYTINSSTIDELIDITPYDYVYNQIQLVDITSLDTLTINTEDKTYELAVSPNTEKETEIKDDEITSEDVDSADDNEEESDYLYYFNDSEVEETAFKELYQKIIGISTIGDIKKEVNDSTPIYEFNFTMNSDSLEELHVAYLPYDGVNFYRVSVNSEENFLVEKAAVDKVIQEIVDFSSK